MFEGYSSGYYTEGAELIEMIMDATRREAEGCDCLQVWEQNYSEVKLQFLDRYFLLKKKNQSELANSQYINLHILINKN